MRGRLCQLIPFENLRSATAMAAKYTSVWQQPRSDVSQVTDKRPTAQPVSIKENGDPRPTTCQSRRRSSETASSPSLSRTRPLLAPKPTHLTGQACVPKSSSVPGTTAVSKMKSDMKSNGDSMPSSLGKEKTMIPPVLPKPQVDTLKQRMPKKSLKHHDLRYKGQLEFESPSHVDSLALQKNLKGVSKIDYQAEKKYFMDICSVIYGILKKLRDKYGETTLPTRLWKSVEEMKQLLEGKDICICVCGHHNCGKSTFLNALIGEDILPMMGMSETSFGVRIQHDTSIHGGVCPDNCPQHFNKCCPRLAVYKGKESYTEVIGPHNIYAYLEQENKKVREGRINFSQHPFRMVLHVNIPLLSGSIPPDWTVSIMDNPGFGEAKEHIQQLAEASMNTSSAYIYLMQTESVGGREAMEFFDELNKCDKSAIADGRLTIGITKFDTHYSGYKMNRKGAVTVEMVKERVVQTTEESTGALLSNDMIIPLCGEWALAGSKLNNCLVCDPRKEENGRYREAVSVLQQCPGLSLPGGQGQPYPEAIMDQFSPLEVVQKLESISGISALKRRIGYVVGKACVKVWATKVHSQLQTSLYDVNTTILETGREKERVYRGKGMSHFNSMTLLNEIKHTRKNIQATLVRGKNKKSTEVWNNLALNYSKDLKKSKPQEAGKKTAKTNIIIFQDKCKQMVADKELGPHEFEIALKKFLDESAAELQSVFDSALGFWNVQGCLREENEHIIEEVASMRIAAERLLKTERRSRDNSLKREEGEETESGFNKLRRCQSVMRAPKLGDIKLKISIPEVTLPWWKKIVEFFRNRLMRKNEVILSTNTSGITSSPTCKVGVKRVSSDQVEPPEDSDFCDESWLESTVVLNESESKERRPKSSMPYEYWTTELQDTIGKVQMYMEEACDQYFKDIEYKAIKYFYLQYFLKAEDLLDRFDKEFGDALSKEEEKLEELNKEVNKLKKELNELKEAKDKLNGLEKQLCDAYAKFCIKHASYTESASLQSESRSKWEDLELAKKEDNKSKTEAIITKELETF